MGAEWSVVAVVVVMFLATLIRSAFGFGEALIAVPLLALLIPVEEAVPLATLTSITVAGVIVVQDWHRIHVHSAGWLVVSTLFGIPLGLWLLTAIAETVVKSISQAQPADWYSHGTPMVQSRPERALVMFP
jgi:uncharacterized membrane protein YfcA